MKQKTHELVKQALIKFPSTRNSDKVLAWIVWKEMGLVSKALTISMENFLKAPSLETISRTRRKIQENNPHLDLTVPVTRQSVTKREQKPIN